RTRRHDEYGDLLATDSVEDRGVAVHAVARLLPASGRPLLWASSLLLRAKPEALPSGPAADPGRGNLPHLSPWCTFGSRETDSRGCCPHRVFSRRNRQSLLQHRIYLRCVVWILLPRGTHLLYPNPETWPITHTAADNRLPGALSFGARFEGNGNHAPDRA